MTEPNPPTQMKVSFALFEGDTLLVKGDFLIRTASESSRFEIRGTSDVLVIEHSFELPACPVLIRLLSPSSVGGRPHGCVLKSALRIGVHDSEDWETIALDRYDLAFRCLSMRADP